MCWESATIRKCRTLCNKAYDIMIRCLSAGSVWLLILVVPTGYLQICIKIYICIIYTAIITKLNQAF